VTFQVGDRVVLDTNVIASVLPKGTQGEVAGISKELAKYRICVSFESVRRADAGTARDQATGGGAMRYECPFCKGRHWFYSTMQLCYARWILLVPPTATPKGDL
jgi:hypothetical protein